MNAYLARAVRMEQPKMKRRAAQCRPVPVATLSLVDEFLNDTLTSYKDSEEESDGEDADDPTGLARLPHKSETCLSRADILLPDDSGLNTFHCILNEKCNLWIDLERNEEHPGHIDNHDY
ncbi:hypothetical protein FQR65_LT09493 [Abscondita terminalis]|nr:hypothetical protein FQR65_LT09493 [Abscondita terminalis]